MRSITVLGFDPAQQDSYLDLTRWSNPEWHNVPLRGFGDRESGFIKPQVVVDEDHEDDLDITKHPVQAGVVVHDHAFKQPASVRLRMGWSNAYTSETTYDDVASTYAKILRLQARRLPFVLYTGKRVYENMLVASLRTHTDQKLEYTLMADVEFREIVLVGTSASGAAVGTSEALADPENNMGQSQRGPVIVSTTKAMIDHLVLSGIPLSELFYTTGAAAPTTAAQILAP